MERGGGGGDPVNCIVLQLFNGFAALGCYDQLVSLFMHEMHEMLQNRGRKGVNSIILMKKQRKGWPVTRDPSQLQDRNLPHQDDSVIGDPDVWKWT